LVASRRLKLQSTGVQYWPRASDGTTIDHLGFRTKDIKTELADLEAKGVKATGAPRQDPNVPTTFATFIEGATGRIEMTQR
jgi:hypothetical protein